MKKSTAYLITVLLGGFFTGIVSAELKTDLLKCSTIENSDNRLDCYDAIAEYYSNIESSNAVPPSTVEMQTSGREKSKAIESAPLVTTAIVSAEPLKIDIDEKTKAEVKDFGASTEDKIQTIQSPMIGEFTSWKKGMVLKLENGQVWRVTSQKNGYWKTSNPMITITRGFFGSFDARVEGLNASVKVKRIK